MEVSGDHGRRRKGGRQSTQTHWQVLCREIRAELFDARFPDAICARCTLRSRCTLARVGPRPAFGQWRAHSRSDCRVPRDETELFLGDLCTGRIPAPIPISSPRRLLNGVALILSGSLRTKSVLNLPLAWLNGAWPRAESRMRGRGFRSRPVPRLASTR